MLACAPLVQASPIITAVLLALTERYFETAEDILWQWSGVFSSECQQYLTETLLLDIGFQDRYLTV